jgi:hypothetical protein
MKQHIVVGSSGNSRNSRNARNASNYWSKAYMLMISKLMCYEPVYVNWSVSLLSLPSLPSSLRAPSSLLPDHNYVVLIRLL